MPQLITALLGSADRSLPPDASVTLMTDRGLSWPVVLDFCLSHRWHFLLRVQGQTRALLADGREVSLAELAPTPGTKWHGPAEVFKDAGWRKVNVSACWPATCDEPWILITDLAANDLRFGQYRKRMRQELSFRDEKSHGLRWTESRVEDPAHAERLLLVMALAMMRLIMLGMKLIRGGERGELERADRRTLSVFQLGLRWTLRQIARVATTGPPKKCVGR